MYITVSLFSSLSLPPSRPLALSSLPVSLSSLPFSLSLSLLLLLLLLLLLSSSSLFFFSLLLLLLLLFSLFSSFTSTLLLPLINRRVETMAVNGPSNVLVCGHSDGRISLRAVWNLQQTHIVTHSSHGAIKCLSFTEGL